MAVIGRHNITKMTSSTTGTGTLTLGNASTGYLSFADAGVADGERVTYTIRDGTSCEVGYGVYDTGGTTLTRDTVLSSTNSGSKINCTGRETVFISYAAEDVLPFASFFTNASDTVADGVDNHTITLDTEWVNPTGLFSLNSNGVRVAQKGWYILYGSVYYTAGAALNGYIKLAVSGIAETRTYISATAAIQEDYMYFGPVMGSMASDNINFSDVQISNHSGQSIDTYIVEATVFKMMAST